MTQDDMCNRFGWTTLYSDKTPNTYLFNNQKATLEFTRVTHRLYYRYNKPVYFTHLLYYRYNKPVYFTHRLTNTIF